MIKKLLLLSLLLVALAYILPVAYFNLKYPILKWDESEFEKRIELPSDFIWGTASASHQVEGNNDNNNWYAWENSVDEEGHPRVHKGQKSGKACDHWNRYPIDILLMKKMGLNSYRFSLAWSKIVPEQGKIDSLALKHYSDKINFIIGHGLEPMITLHHFSHPLWFDSLGGFEKEENIKHFVDFSKLVFKEYSDRVKKWCTINEPNVYVTGGYVQGNFPPGKKDPALGGSVLFNLLKAHTDVYRILKKLRNGPDAEIGIVKDIFQFDPKDKWDLRDWILCRTVSKAFNDSTLDFLKTGKFKFEFPGISIDTTYQAAKQSYDFAGLNYYSHIMLDFNSDQAIALSPIMPEGEIKTDMDYTIYPEGLYRAIKQISSLNAPIYITENGIADKRDDRRGLFIKRYLYALMKAIQDGMDVRGYYYWSLTDNFEWSEGYSMKFGLYEVDFDNQVRDLRIGSNELIRIIEKSKETK